MTALKRSASAWLALLLVLSCVSPLEGADPKDCEVCVHVVDSIRQSLTASERSDMDKIESRIGSYCSLEKSLKLSAEEKKICYHLDPIRRELSRPISIDMPTEDICMKKLRKKNPDFCSVRYPVKVNQETDLTKLKVKDLKKILADHGVACPECLEKSDYIRKIQNSVLEKEV